MLFFGNEWGFLYKKRNEFESCYSFSIKDNLKFESILVFLWFSYGYFCVLVYIYREGCFGLVCYLIRIFFIKFFLFISNISDGGLLLCSIFCGRK